jgi:hypothetical protein
MAVVATLAAQGRVLGKDIEAARHFVTALRKRLDDNNEPESKPERWVVWSHNSYDRKILCHVACAGSPPCTSTRRHSAVTAAFLETRKMATTPRRRRKSPPRFSALSVDFRKFWPPHSAGRKICSNFNMSGFHRRAFERVENDWNREQQSLRPFQQSQVSSRELALRRRYLRRWCAFAGGDWSPKTLEKKPSMRLSQGPCAMVRGRSVDGARPFFDTAPESL